MKPISSKKKAYAYNEHNSLFCFQEMKQFSNDRTSY